MNTCKIEGCKRKYLASGFCNMHYRRWRRHGDPLYIRPQSVCEVEQCSERVFGHGFCSKHWQRWKRHGDPTAGQTGHGEPLKWLECHVDHYGHECLTWPFSISSNGYASGVHVNGERVSAHRVMCQLAHGEPPTPKHYAAHNCGKGHLACVNPRHLRWATPTENMLDRGDHGTAYRGEVHHQCHLSADDVREIRSRKGLEHQKSLAKRFGVSRSAISSVQNGYTWAWLE